MDAQKAGITELPQFLAGKIALIQNFILIRT
jgi:hypothetical protein